MSKNSTKKAYSAKIDFAFDNNGQRTQIDSEKIVYIMIEHNYDEEVLPLIYITFSVDNDLYSAILKYKDSAKFYLNIKQENKNSRSSIAKKAINGTFNYIPSATNPNFQEDLTDENDFLDNSYKRIMVGLVSIELTNKLRKSFNDVYREVDQKTLLGIALEGTNCVIENIAYNKEYDRILVPPIASRYKMIEFIFNDDNFYDTNFRYFMDFERSYLVSKRGDPIESGDGQLSTVIVDIKSVTEDEAYTDGIDIQNGAYYININPSNSNVTLNEGTEKVANQLVAVNEELTQKMDMNINNTEGSTTKQMFVRTSNPALYKNEMETDTIITEIVKQHIDGSVFTPNKCIIVNNYGDYSKYNGKYLMIYKREFYKCVAGEFVMSCNVGLKKIGNIESAKSVTTSKKTRYRSGSSSRSSTSSRGTYGKSASGSSRSTK